MLIPTAIILFVIAALFGSIILTAILKNRSKPKSIVTLHGLFAGSAILLLIIDVIKGHVGSLLITSLVIFIAAALGGLTLYKLDSQQKHIPKALAFMHPLAGITALIVLIFYAMQ